MKAILSRADNKTALWSVYLLIMLPSLESTWHTSLTPMKGMLRFTSMEPKEYMSLIALADQKDHLSMAI